MAIRHHALGTTPPVCSEERLQARCPACSRYWVAAKAAPTTGQAAHRLAHGHRLGQSPPRRIAVFRALQLGDLLCAVPALRALRTALPSAHITLIGLPWARDFVRRFSHLLDAFLEFPGAPGLPERVAQPGEWECFVGAAHAREFDLALQMHGSGIHSNPVTAALGARLTAGFFLPGDPCPDTQRYLAYPEHEPEILRLLRLMEFLGIPLQGEHVEFPILEQDRRDPTTALTGMNLRDRSYVCIHPGARSPARRWPPQRFAEVGDALAAGGLQVVLTGTESERPVTEAVASAMRSQSLDLAGRTTLGALAVLIGGAQMLVCNDTGVSHIAAALKVPSVVIFTASSPQRWGPLDLMLHRRVGLPDECSGCNPASCPIGHLCALKIGADAVLCQAEQFLQPDDP